MHREPQRQPSSRPPRDPDVKRSTLLATPRPASTRLASFTQVPQAARRSRLVLCNRRMMDGCRGGLDDARAGRRGWPHRIGDLVAREAVDADVQVPPGVVEMREQPSERRVRVRVRAFVTPVAMLARHPCLARHLPDAQPKPQTPSAPFCLNPRALWNGALGGCSGGQRSVSTLHRLD